MPDHVWSELAAGDEFAGYRIEGRLGRGGMGILYLAVEPGLERRVALKLIAPEAAAEEVFARRFAEESRIAASIEHPNVVPIYAAGEEDGVPWIAMRYVAGSDLARRITREGQLEPEHAVRADRPGRQRARRDPRRRPRPPRRQAGQRPAERRSRGRARLHHRLRRRPQRRHPVRADPDRPLRRHPRLRRPGADLGRPGRRPGRRLRARLPPLQSADRRGAVPARGRGGSALRPPERPAAGCPRALAPGGADGARRRRRPGAGEGAGRPLPLRRRPRARRRSAVAGGTRSRSRSGPSRPAPRRPSKPRRRCRCPLRRDPRERAGASRPRPRLPPAGAPRPRISGPGSNAAAAAAVAGPTAPRRRAPSPWSQPSLSRSSSPAEAAAVPAAAPPPAPSPRPNRPPNRPPKR